MAKQNKPISKSAPTPQVQQAEPKKVAVAERGFSIHYFKVQCVIIAIIGLLFYGNTIGNEYALDDRPIIIENEYVKQGFSGIPSILLSDAFSSYLNQQNSGNALSGGRYRPLSIVTFAIEQQFLGTRGVEELADTTKQIKGNLLTEAATNKINRDMHVRHFLNVILYIISIMVVLHFMRTVLFPGNTLLPFIAALLFLIHPIHTEVVANVKSRDEILSLMFIALTLMYSFRFYDEKQSKDRIKALIFFFLALLSKEYAIILIVLIPLMYTVLRNETFSKAFSKNTPFFIPFAVYLLLRINATKGGGGVPDDIMNVPYLFATPLQKIASIVANLFNYIKLLFFPHPLSSDYSYKQIPYSDFSSPLFYVSLVIYSCLVGWLYYCFQKRHILFFAVAFFLFNLALVGNVFINIGAPMGERLVYHSSLGFAIIIAYLLYQLYLKIKSEKVGLATVGGIMLVLTVLSGFKTISRNPQWKNDRTLFLTDVKTSPNSVLILSNAGSASIDIADELTDTVKKQQLYKEGIAYFDRALALHPTFPTAFLNKGVAYYKSGYADSALNVWDSVRKYYPNHPTLPYVYKILSNYYYAEGLKYGKSGQHNLAAISFGKAAKASPQDADIWYNAGFANLSAGNYQAAAQAFERSLKLAPNNNTTRQFYQQALSHLPPQ